MRYGIQLNHKGDWFFVDRLGKDSSFFETETEARIAAVAKHGLNPDELGQWWRVMPVEQ
jgi:hypothetical protein